MTFGAIITVLVGVFKFFDDVRAFLAFRQGISDAQWAVDGRQLTDAIKGATTDAQRAELVRKLASHASNV